MTHGRNSFSLIGRGSGYPVPLPPEWFADIPFLSNFDQIPKKRLRIILTCSTSF